MCCILATGIGSSRKDIVVGPSRPSVLRNVDLAPHGEHSSCSQVTTCWAHILHVMPFFSPECSHGIGPNAWLKYTTNAHGISHSPKPSVSHSFYANKDIQFNLRHTDMWTHPTQGSFKKVFSHMFPSLNTIVEMSHFC